MLSLALCAALWVGAPVSVQGGGTGLDLDALLSVKDGPDGPLACTGRLLSMESVDPVPGLVGGVTFGGPLPGRTALLRAEFSLRGVPLTPEMTESLRAPSHLRRIFDLGRGLMLTEHAFITSDDAVVLLLAFMNGAQEDRNLDLHLSSDLAREPDLSQSKQNPVGLSAYASTIPLRLDGVEFRVRVADGGVPEPLAHGSFQIPDFAPARAVLHLLVAGDQPIDGGAIRAVFADGSSARPAPTDARAAPRPTPGGGGAATHHVSWSAPPGRFFRQLIIVGRTEGTRAVTGPDVLAAVLETPPVEGRPPVLRGSFVRPQESAARAVHATLAATGEIVVRDDRPDPELMHHITLAAGETRTVSAVLALAGRPLVSFLQAMGRTEDPRALARQRGAYAEWFTTNVPGFSCSSPHVERNYWRGWVGLRRRFVTSEQTGAGGVLILDQRTPRASATAAALPSLVANLRWLRDPKPLASHLRAFVRDGVRAEIILGGTAPGHLDADRDTGDIHAPARAFLRALDVLPPVHKLRSLAASVPEPQGEDEPVRGLRNLATTTPDEILRRLTGLSFLADGSLQLHPEPGALEHFRFDHIPFRGHDLSVIWDRPGGEHVHRGFTEGLTILLDGAPLHHSPEPEAWVLGAVRAD